MNVDEKKLGKQLTVHLNGGNKFSELHYRIYYDEQETDIMHVRRTDGSPQYKITSDIWLRGEEQFDALGKTRDALMGWLKDKVREWIEENE